jgi:hypothetical protein
VDLELGPEFEGCFEANNTSTPGVLVLAMACGEGHSGAPLVLWNVTFMAAMVTEPVETELRVTDVLLADAAAPPQEIPAVGGSDTLTIFVGVCGDQNGDGEVDIRDAITDLQIIVGLIRPTPEQLLLSDSNRNGRIDVGDVVLTLQRIVELIPTLGCGPR